MSALSKLSIRAKITMLALVVSAIPAILISVISVKTSTDALEHALADALMVEASTIGGHIDEFYDARIIDMQVLSQADVLESSDTEAMVQYFDEILEVNTTLSNLLVINPDGNISAEAGPAYKANTPVASVNPELAGLFSQVLKAKQGDVYMTDAIPHQGDISVFLMTPITDDTNTIVEAVLLAETPIAPVRTMMENWDESIIGDKSVYLLNDDSLVIVTGDENQQLFDLFNDMKVKPEVGEATEEDGSQAFVIYEDFHGHLVMAGMADMEAHGANDALDWGIVGVAEIEAIGAPAIKLQNQITLITIFCVVLAGVLAYVLARILVKPLENINTKMQELAAGGGDLTQRMDTTAQDEIGKVAVSFNQFIGNLHALIEDFKGSAENMTYVVDSMSDVTSRTKSECMRQQTETDMVATAITEMSSAAHEVASHAQEAADSARQADDLSQQGSNVVQETITAINSLANNLGSATAVVEKLETNVSNISAMVDVIRGIAEQTNLLALNAAIEAARAGEQGRGFAVVADEVRALASKTQESTEEINNLITILKDASDEAVKTIEESKDMSSQTVAKADMAGASLADIAHAVSTISNMNIQIAAAAEQQTAVTEELTRNVTSISDATTHVTEAAAESETTSERISEIALSIKDKVKRFVV